MDIAGSVALVTGANRGIGRRFAAQLVERGATKVYATTRTAGTIDLPGVEELVLDITDPASVAAAAAHAHDVTLLVNNAGISTYSDLVHGDMAQVRREMDTHFFGTLAMVRAFAPSLAAGGGGAVLNVLSALSFLQVSGASAYSAAKAAQWSLTNGVRLDLAAQGTLVVGLHVGAVDTDMMAGWDIPKLDPADVARAGLDAVQAGRLQVLVDADSERAKASVGQDLALVYPAAVVG